MIEKATVSDSQEFLALQKLAYRSEAEIYKDDRLPPLLQTLEDIEEDFKDQLFLKAAAKGRKCGYWVFKTAKMTDQTNLVYLGTQQDVRRRRSA